MRVVAALLAALTLSCVRLHDGATVVPTCAGMSPVGPLVAGTTVEQEFVSDGAAFDEVSLLLATYGRSNASTLEVSLDIETSGSWRQVTRVTRTASGLRDNSFESFRVPPQAPYPGTRIRVRLSSPDARDASAVTAWMAPPPVPGGVRLRVKGLAREGAIPLVLARERETRGADSLALVGGRLRGVIPAWLRPVALVAGLAAPLLFVLVVVRLAFTARADTLPETSGP